MDVMSGETPLPKNKNILRSVERLALAYYAPMWKTTPTASLQIILNQIPSHLEVLSVGIKILHSIQKPISEQFMGWCSQQQKDA